MSHFFKAVLLHLFTLTRFCAPRPCAGEGKRKPARKIFLHAAIALMALAGVGNAAAQTGPCSLPDPLVPQVKFNQLNVQPDTPDGAVIGTATQTYSVSCNGLTTTPPSARGYYFTYYSNSTYGGPSTYDPVYVWKTSVASVGVRVTNLTNGKVLKYCATSNTIAENCLYNTFLTDQPFTAFTYTFTLQFELIKIGAITTSVSPGGPIIWLASRGYSLTSSYTNPNATGIAAGTTVLPSTCKVTTPNLSVGLPSLKVSDLSPSGATAGGEDFQINLSCNGGKTIFVTLTDAADPSNTTNQLNLSSQSTARNVKLQIVKSDKSLVYFGPATAVANNPGQWKVDSSGNPGTTGNARSIGLTVQYISTGAVTPGKVEAAAMFTLFYQ